MALLLSPPPRSRQRSGFRGRKLRRGKGRPPPRRDPATEMPGLYWPGTDFAAPEPGRPAGFCCGGRATAQIPSLPSSDAAGRRRGPVRRSVVSSIFRFFVHLRPRHDTHATPSSLSTLGWRFLRDDQHVLAVSTTAVAKSEPRTALRPWKLRWVPASLMAAPPVLSSRNSSPQGKRSRSLPLSLC